MSIEIKLKTTVFNVVTLRKLTSIRENLSWSNIFNQDVSKGGFTLDIPDDHRGLIIQNGFNRWIKFRLHLHTLETQSFTIYNSSGYQFRLFN